MTSYGIGDWLFLGGDRDFQVFCIRARSMALLLKGPNATELFSERNRLGCRVLPLGKGWRVLLQHRPRK